MIIEDDVEEDEIAQRFVEQCPISELLLIRLSQCAVTTRSGAVDFGSPKSYLQLQALNLTKRVGEGFQVTPEGFALVSKWRKKIK